jgi:hypothetical protein
MKKLTKVDVAISGLLGGLVKLVEQWEPGTLGSETEYRDSLLKFIRSSVPEDCRVEREYRHGGTTADLFIQNMLQRRQEMPPNQTSIMTRILRDPINLSWLGEAGNTLQKGFSDPGENQVLLPSS